MNGDIRLLRSRCGTFHPYVSEIALDKSGCLIVEKLWRFVFNHFPPKMIVILEPSSLD